MHYFRDVFIYSVKRDSSLDELYAKILSKTLFQMHNTRRCRSYNPAYWEANKDWLISNYRKLCRSESSWLGTDSQIDDEEEEPGIRTKVKSTLATTGRKVEGLAAQTVHDVSTDNDNAACGGGGNVSPPYHMYVPRAAQEDLSDPSEINEQLKVCSEQNMLHRVPMWICTATSELSCQCGKKKLDKNLEGA